MHGNFYAIKGASYVKITNFTKENNTATIIKIPLLNSLLWKISIYHPSELMLLIFTHFFTMTMWSCKRLVTKSLMALLLCG